MNLTNQLLDASVRNVVRMHEALAPRPVPDAESDTRLFTTVLGRSSGGAPVEATGPSHTDEDFRKHGLSITHRRIAESEREPPRVDL